MVANDQPKQFEQEVRHEIAPEMADDLAAFGPETEGIDDDDPAEADPDDDGRDRKAPCRARSLLEIKGAQKPKALTAVLNPRGNIKADGGRPGGPPIRTSKPRPPPFERLLGPASRVLE